MKHSRTECPSWFLALDAATLRRAVVVGCALAWVSVIGLIVA